MMMRAFNYRRYSVRTFTVAFVVCVVIAGIVYAIGPWLRDLAAVLMVTVDDTTTYALVPRDVLIARLESAENELARTRYQAVLYEALATKVQNLEAELGYKTTGAYATARVLAAPPRTHYDTLLIDLGADDGVVLGDIAFVEGIALGSVSGVSSRSATVALFSSPGSTRDASVGEKSAIVVVSGLGGGSFDAVVPGGLEVQQGDAVIDTRTQLVFAFVRSVVHREIDTEQYLMLSSPVSPATVRSVSLTHAP